MKAFPSYQLLTLFISVICLLQAVRVHCSDGDRSPFYQKCVANCLHANCTEDGTVFTINAAVKQETINRILQWNCMDECKYHCMWLTVHAFTNKGYDIPKFHGKWPFTRIAGVQEPASALASLLNLAAHVYMFIELRSRFSVKNTPLLFFWYLFFAVCAHAWTWSTIFHTRDTEFTEFMDYSCALSMVMALLVAAIVRVFHKRRKMIAVILVPLLLYYIKHVEYLYKGRFDYGYNMLVNLFFGVLGSVIWLAWSAVQWLGGRRYAWRAAAFTLVSGAALTLELLDFPPLHGWDPHALWHLATVPLPLLFYRYVIDDLHYLQSSRPKIDDFSKLN